MALSIPSIGLAKPVETTGLPGALRGLGSIGRGLRFASQLERKLQDVTADGSDLLSQLAGLLQAGTPTPVIVEKIAGKISSAIGKALGNEGNVDAQRTLQRALAAALAPPGTSPPTKGLQQAATLEQRVKEILTTLTSELKNAGQQSEFPGRVLDAESARETPAPQTKPTTGQRQLPAALLSFANPPESAPLASADPLTRMIARAVNAGTQHSAAAPAKIATPGTPQVPNSNVLFQRLIAIVAEQHSGAQTGGKSLQQFQANQSPSPAQSSQPGPPAGSAFAAQVAAVPAAPVHAASNAANVSKYVPIDPQAVIEQVVKGIVVRNSGGSSEVRLRLQPEHLGDVSLKLTVDGNTITANVIAQNAHVRDVLLSNQQQLARTLSDAGLSLGNFSVDVSGGNPGFTHQQQQMQQQRLLGRAGAFGAALAGEDETWADPRIGPPIIHGPRALVLNYLA